jgi:choice-of-anchor B domain-containing protein
MYCPRILFRVAAILLLFSAHVWTPRVAAGQAPCVDGMVLGTYPCESVELLAHLPNNQFDGLMSSDVWGWTDPLDGSEYVLLCKRTALWFIDVSLPMSPIVLGSMPTAGSGAGSNWRDVKVIGNKAYVVSEIPLSGLQVFDLTRLRDITNPPEILLHDAQAGGFSNAHNVAVHDASQTLYVCGASNHPGLVIYQHHDDDLPELLGVYDESGYIHDAQIVTYQGPDSEHVGKTLAFSANGDFIAISDVGDPTDVVLMATAAHDSIGYVHQGWLSTDQKYFFVGDETDEILGLVGHTRTLIFDVQDLDSPYFLGSWSQETTASDHNMYSRGPWLYQSNYKAGFRILNTSGAAELAFEEMAYFDSDPAAGGPGFEGSWSNFPYFESGTIAVADMQAGLFLIRTTMLSASPFYSETCPEDTLELTITIDSALTGPVALDITPSPAWISDEVLPGPGEWTVQVAGFPGIGPGGYNVRGIASGTPHVTRVYVDVTMDVVHYPDLDGDGYGTYAGAVEGCGVGPGYSMLGGDCDDANPDVHPGLEDPCDGVNNDCDQMIDEDGQAVTFFVDIDGDGHAGMVPFSSCNYPPIWYLFGDDCDDLNQFLYPGAAATGEGVDNNCDGVIYGFEHGPDYCLQDVFPDGWVTIQDVLEMLNQYGDQGMNTADFNFDLLVGVADILIMLTVFGEQCP